ncbi:MAG: hypothetical protein AAGA09_06215 [Pseudomonadota bacterium]
MLSKWRFALHPRLGNFEKLARRLQQTRRKTNIQSTKIYGGNRPARRGFAAISNGGFWPIVLKKSVFDLARAHKTFALGYFTLRPQF